MVACKSALVSMVCFSYQVRVWQTVTKRGCHILIKAFFKLLSKKIEYGKRMCYNVPQICLVSMPFGFFLMCKKLGPLDNCI